MHTSLRQQQTEERIMKSGMRPRTAHSMRILLLALLLRSSDAFMASPAGVVANSRHIAVGGQGTRRDMISRIPEERYLRRERLATLGKVRWRRRGGNDATSCVLEARGSFATGMEEGVDGRGSCLVSQEEDRISGDSLLSATTSVVRPAVRLAATAAMGDGNKNKSLLKSSVRRVRKAVRQVFRRSSPGTQAGAAAVASAGAMCRGAEQPPRVDGTLPGGTAIDVDDVLRQSALLLKDRDPDRTRKVLILMSDTGGGHRASAQALKAAFDDLYPGAIDVDIVDLWTTHAPWPLNKSVESYQFMAKRPAFWKVFWEWGRFPPTRRMTLEMTNLQCHKRFRSMMEDYEPDLVISVHPLCQDVPMRVMKRMGGGTRTIPFVTVVTDLGGAHPTWFHNEIDACFVPSERLAVVAKNCGLTQDQIRLHGLPIRPGFWGEQSAKEELQQKLGLKPGVKACLVVGGGDGVGGLKSIANSVGHKLGEHNAEAQVVVVCGTNDVVKTSLERGDWASNVHMHVKGFVSNMEEWMGAVDCIVTKAGPGTIAEATIRGLPIMLSAFLPGQEAGNVPYVTEGGFGSFSKDPRKIADTVSRWLRDDDLLAKMSNKAKEASRPKATYRICEDIGAMLFGTGKDTGKDPPNPVITDRLSVTA